MSMSRPDRPMLKAEADALQDYFGSLLEEHTVAPTLLRADLLQPPRVSSPEPISAETVAVETALPAVPPPSAVTEYPRPEAPFPALVLEAGNLTLLAPLEALGGVASMDGMQIRSTPNHSSWYLGLVDTPQGRVQLIDLAAVITPEDRPYEPDTATQVVFLAGSRFALACRSILGTRVIDPQELRWRTRRSRLPWLAGVEREQMATLLDLEALDRTLDTGSWEPS